MSNKGRNMLNGNSIVKVLLSLVLVLAMFSQFALPAMADMVVEEPDPNFMPATVSTTSTTQVTLYTYTVPSNCTATFVSLAGQDGFTASAGTMYLYVNGSLITSCTTSGAYGYYGEWPIDATAGETISIQAKANSGDTPSVDGCNFGGQNVPYTDGGDATYLLVEYDMANQATAQAADTEATSAASSASSAATDAAAAQTAATSAQTAANSADTEATSAANNTTYNSESAAYWADNANTNASTAATQATTAASNTAYDSQSAAYWAYQASQNTSNTTVPIISSVTGVNMATCTTGSSYQANVNISPGSSITYALNSITGPGGAPTFGPSGNVITISNLIISGAYTVTFTATYTPSMKTAQGSFVFFKI